MLRKKSYSAKGIARRNMVADHLQGLEGVLLAMRCLSEGW
jgi:hypothetical protein